MTAPQPPDGGWGWCCVFGCFLTHFIDGGLQRSSGLIFLEIKEEFGGSAASIAWSISLKACVRSVLSPVAGALSKRFSCRAVVIAGSLMSAVAMFINAFSPGLYFFYFSYGVLGGIGSSLTYSPGLITIGLYFKKRIGLAVGLATAGVGIGAFVIPPLLEIGFDYYGFTGACIVLSSFLLNHCISGSLYRPLELHYKIQRIQDRKQSSEETEMYLRQRNIKVTDLETVDACGRGKYEISSRNSDDNDEELEETNSFLKNSPPMIGVHIVTPDDKNNEHPRKNRKVLERIFRKINEHFEISLLKNIRFLCFCIALSLFTMGLSSTVVYTPPLVESHGISELDAAYTVSVFGICDLCGRIIVSTFLDCAVVQPHRQQGYVVLMLLHSVVTLLFTVPSDFYSFAILSGISGFVSGGCVSQKSIIVVDILGRDKLHTSLGVVLFFQGLAFLVGPPMAGMLADVLGRYEDIFYCCSAVISLGATIFIVGQVINKYQRRKC